jgi:uncharacterized protein with LGFP repeats
MLAGVLTPPPGSTQPAQAAPSAGDLGCKIALGSAAMAEWTLMGGADGRLGCPSEAESASPPSPKGSRAGVTPFGQAGAIVTVTSGPDAGKAFAVFGCAWRLYFQFGGPGGWLGLPLEDPQNNPDGQSQHFEGGVITATRAYDSCDAEPSGTSD